MSGVEFAGVEDCWARGLRFVNADNAVLVLEVRKWAPLPPPPPPPPERCMGRRRARPAAQARGPLPACPQSERVSVAGVAVEVSQPRLGPPEGPFKRRFDGHWGLRIGAPV